MKILHTADWHIGQFIHEYNRSFELQQFLNWFLNTLTKECIDVLLISSVVLNGSNITQLINIEMDTLERPQHQDRKVGVISHMKEMTERIPVQIKVNNQQSGRSKVEVIGI